MRTYLLLAAAGLLAACAVGSPANYRNDIDAFAAGVANARQAYVTERNGYVDYLESLERDALLAEGERPRLVDGAEFGACAEELDGWKDGWSPDLGVSDKTFARNLRTFLLACRLHKEIALDAGEAGPQSAVPLSLVVGDPTPAHTRLAEALVSYAARMQALAEVADDRRAFEDAAGGAREALTGLLASAGDLGEELGLEDPIAIDEELTVVGNALITAVGARLEARRREALSDIAGANQVAVEAAADKLAAISRYYHLAALSDLVERYGDAVDETADEAVRASAGAYAEAVDDVFARHEAVVAYARTDPGKVFIEMKDAHAALVKRLADPGARLQELAGSIEDFHQTSQDVLAAIRGIRVKLGGGSEP